MGEGRIHTLPVLLDWPIHLHPVQHCAVWRSSMLMFKKYVNVGDIIQGRVFGGQT